MRGLRKKAVVLATVAALAMSSLVGCGNYAVDNNKVAVMVGDSNVSLGVVNFYLRYDQSMIEAAYASSLGESFWKLEISEGTTFEGTEKESIVNALTQMYILEDHMAEYDVTLTEEELAAIEKAADDFIANNSEEALKLVSGDKEIIKEVLRLCKISMKMYDAIVADVSTEVSDEEAAQKKLAYLGFTKTDNVTLEEAKEEAELFLEEAKKVGDLLEVADEQQAPAHEYTFDKNTTEISKEIVEAADKLKEGEFAELVKSSNDIYYVVQLISEFDKEATEAKKAEIVQTRQDDKFQEVYEPWQKATTIVIDDNVLDDISMHGLKVVQKSKEENK